MPRSISRTVAAPLHNLPDGIRSNYVDHVNGLRMHVLEAGYGDPKKPVVLLLHGFPEIAYSWRRQLPALAEAGYHVLAPDLRGYGRTTGCDTSYDGDLQSFRMVNLVVDLLALLQRFGCTKVHAVIGHDFGSILAAWCAITRPDVFPAVCLMCAPFGGTPKLDVQAMPVQDPMKIHQDLAALNPPRKHYHWYYSAREADANMHDAKQGLRQFIRAYFHYKSGDWKGNKPFRLKEWTADQLALMPTYYIMNAQDGMAETVAPFMPDRQVVESCQWLTESELDVYVEEYERTGFQGGLQWYRCETSGINIADFKMFSGRTIDVPSFFIGGEKDWGVWQRPGIYEAMQNYACTDVLGCHLVAEAGHWVQQENAAIVSKLLIDFLSHDRLKGI